MKFKVLGKPRSPFSGKPFYRPLTSGAGSGGRWVLRASAADNDWTAIAWSPPLGLFCAVASSGVGNRVMTSSDGINWVLRASAADNSWQAVTWADALGLFIATANSGVGNRSMSSPDGINWTIGATAADNGWGGVAWSPALGLACACSNSGNPRVMYTADGTNWSTAGVAGTGNNAYRAITWSAPMARFEMAGGFNARYSADGINWVVPVSAPALNSLSTIWVDFLALFIMFPFQAPEFIFTSPDADVWASASIPQTNAWTGAASSGDIVWAVANTGVGNRVMSSRNGTSWSSGISAADNGWRAVAYAPALDRFCAVAASGVGNRVMTLG